MKKFLLIAFLGILSIWVSAQNHFTESFTTGVPATYGDNQIFTLSSGEWTGHQVYKEAAAASYGATGAAARINDDIVGAHLTTFQLNTVGTVSFYYRILSAGSSTFKLQKSVDGAAFTDICSQEYNSLDYTFFSYNVNDASSNIKIRILNDNQSGHLIIDEMTITQYNVASSEIIVSKTALPSFGYVYVDDVSLKQFYQVSASGLTEGVLITAPASYLISTNCTENFSSSLVINHTGGVVAPTLIYVRCSPSVVSVANGNVTHSSAGCSNKLVAVSGFGASAPNLSSYYSTATGTGFTLKSQLKSIISSGHSVPTYDGLWTQFQTTDKKPNGKVWDMYSDNPCGESAYEFTFISQQCGTYAVEGDCYNREHSLPKSWFDEGTPMYSDMFHLYPTDGKVNGWRSDLPFGEVNNPTTTTTNNSEVGPNVFDSYSGTVFEPIDEYKGDFARSYFYMATRYQDVVTAWSGSPMLNGTNNQVFTDWALKLLIKWHSQDPVSHKEKIRNNKVDTIQHNRNPFIDHPEWVYSIWAPAPTAQASQFIADNISENSIKINWTRGNGDSVIVVARAENAVNFDPENGYNYSANANFGNGSQIGNDNFVIYKGTGTTVTCGTLNIATTYYFAVYEYNNDFGVVYNRNELSGNATTTNSYDNNSTIVEPLSQTASTNIASTATTEGTAIEVFRFKIKDQGTADALATKVSNIKLKPAPSNTAVWTNNMQSVILKTNGSEVLTQTPIINNDFINIPIEEGNLSVSDNSEIQCEIYIFLKTNNIEDENVFSCMIDANNHGFTAFGTGSAFATTFAGGDVVSNNYTIKVDATQLVFVQQPTNVFINSSMSPAVEVAFADANGNIDKNKAGEFIQITASAGSLNGSPVVSVVATTGIASFSTLSFSSAATNVILTATDHNNILGINESTESNFFNISAQELLIISEVIDPSDITTARFVELYNAGESVVDFSILNYYIARQANGTTWASAKLTGNISPKTTYIIAENQTNFNSAYGYNADFIFSGISGNGNDGYFLFKNGDQTIGTLVDAYGVKDENGTGKPWEYTDKQAFRKSNIMAANATWTAIEWTIVSATASTGTPFYHPVTVWKGTTSTEWANSANWTNNIPLAETDVIINAATFQPILSNDFICKKLKIKAGASLQIAPTKFLEMLQTIENQAGVTGIVIKSDNSGTGSLLHSTAGVEATVEQFLTYNRWWYISTPVNNATSNVFNVDYETTNNNRLYKYNEVELNHGWQQITNTSTNISVLGGYAFKKIDAGDVTIQFQGVLNEGNTGNINNLTRTVGQIKEGYNLVGNPYCSAIDWNSAEGWTKTNIENNTIYYRTNGNFASWNGVSDQYVNGGQRYIPAMQAFWVRVSEGNTNGTLITDNRVRVNNNQTFYKNNKEPENELRIQISNNLFADETVIYFRENAVDVFDVYDAHKILGDDEIPQIFSRAGSYSLSINGLNLLDFSENVIIPLGIKVNQSGSYNIKVLTSVFDNPAVAVFLFDNFSLEFTQLFENSSANIEMQAGTEENRFSIIFTTDIITSNQMFLNDTENPFKMYIDNTNLFINNMLNEKFDLEIFNCSGQKIHSQLQLVQAQIALKSGNLYFVKCKSGHNIFTTKIFVP